MSQAEAGEQDDDLDPRTVLGVALDARPDQIRAAYRRAARTTHPDRGGNAAAFHRVHTAYLALTQPALDRASAFAVPTPTTSATQASPLQPAAASRPPATTGTSAPPGAPARRPLTGRLSAARASRRSTRRATVARERAVAALLARDGRDGRVLRVLEAQRAGATTLVVAYCPGTGATVHQHVWGAWARDAWVLVDDLGHVLDAVTP